ncbi:hypothetical protein PG993_006997 [Apiospora rasikravindrae]|uniref:Uncharacterized protein n=1 Tax=Apiospora rasikravindrae TaxID=990691 RepID=A0ABR1SXN1_9PEZI
MTQLVFSKLEIHFRRAIRSAQKKGTENTLEAPAIKFKFTEQIMFSDTEYNMTFGEDVLNTQEMLAGPTSSELVVPAPECNNCKILFRHIMQKLEHLEAELGKNNHLEQRFDRVDQELSRNDRLERIERDLVRVGDSTVALANDLRRFVKGVCIVLGGSSNLVSKNEILVYGTRHEKALPLTPGMPAAEQAADATASDKTYSPDTYISLLEEENEQLRLRNQELVHQLRSLQYRLADETETRKDVSEKAGQYKAGLEKRDALVGDIANAIIREFERYKDVISGRPEEQIRVYYRSSFDHDSPV